MLKSLLILAMATMVRGQVAFPGACSTNVNVVKGFNLTAYLGTWYEIYRYTQKDEVGLECVTANYKMANATFVAVNNTGIMKNKLYDRQGQGTPLDQTGDAKLVVSFDDFTTKSPYWVLTTDYSSYSLVYSCRDLGNGTKVVTSWVLSRKPALTAQDAVTVNQYLISNPQLSDVLEWRNYQHTIQWGDTCRINSSSAAKATTLLLALGVFLAKFL